MEGEDLQEESFERAITVFFVRCPPEEMMMREHHTAWEADPSWWG